MHIRVPRKSLVALYVIVQHNISEYERVMGDPDLARSARLTSADLLNVPSFVALYNEFVERNKAGVPITASSLNAMGVVTDRMLNTLREAGLLRSERRDVGKFSPTKLGEALIMDRLRLVEPWDWPLEMSLDRDTSTLPDMEQFGSLSLS